MDKSLASLDWTLVQSFLAVAEAGSLSAAARATRVSQPTLGRHIHDLEAQLGVALFSRVPRGLEPTEAALDLLGPARAMRQAAGQMALAAAGRAEGLSGVVRITASLVVSHHLLPPILAGIRARHPEIELELVPSDTSENLLFREADIALRMYRPEQLDVVTRHLGDLALGMFGARSYLDRAGRPQTPDDLRGHDFVGFDRSEFIIHGMRSMGMEVDRHFFATRCDHQTTYWELVRAGCGLGFGQLSFGLPDPALERLLPDLPLPAIPVWLTAHEAMRQTPRIRRVWDMLAEGLTPHLS